MKYLNYFKIFSFYCHIKILKVKVDVRINTQNFLFIKTECLIVKFVGKGVMQTNIVINLVPLAVDILNHSELVVI